VQCAGAARVRINPTQLQSVLRNLVVNAVEAVAEDGSITVETADVDGGALITVTDTGRGMTAEFIEQKLFRPFQTTKTRGLGIGLFQCRQIVRAFGGTFTAESSEGKGTRMTVRLPAGKDSGQLAVGSGLLSRRVC
jgi:signal transduction histidine kinase